MGNLADIIRQVWPEWTVEKPIGRGAFGQVYQAVRVELGFESRCAIKVIAVPPDPSDVEALRLEDMEDEEIRQYYRRMADSFAGEIRMLDTMKGAPHIVGIEDYRMAENPETLGWIILIRMELLKPFPVYVKEHRVTEAETVRLGDELCEALEVCHGQHVLHRDIKPQNIFVDRFGSFRLGDFGIARKMESLTVSMSQKGTYGYIAPEVNNGQHYDERADIYSLGLVMYQLTNEGRLPFLFSAQEAKSPEKRTESLQRRLRGEELPPPCAASPGLSEVILKACRYRPEERYRTAAELKDALAALAGSAPAVPASVPSAQPVQPEQPVQPVQPPEPEQPVQQTSTETSVGTAKEEDPDETLSARASVIPAARAANAKNAKNAKNTADKTNRPSQTDEPEQTAAAPQPAEPNGLQTPDLDDRTVTAAESEPHSLSENEQDDHDPASESADRKKKAILILVIIILSLVVVLNDILQTKNTPQAAVNYGGASSGTTSFDGAFTPEAGEDFDEPAAETYTLSYSEDEKGNVLFEPDTVALGDTVKITAEPKDGYRFKKWEAEGIILEKPENDSENSFVLTSPDMTLKADFARICSVSVDSSDGGTASAAPLNGVEGETVTLSAEPKDGYKFKEWKIVSGHGTISEDTLTIGEEDITVRPVFEAIEYTITVTSTGSGTASPSKTTGFIGDTVTLTALPDDGYRFIEWRKKSAGGTLNGNEATLGAEDLRVEAVFEAISYKITVTGTENGTASVSKTTGIKGDTVTLSAVPSDGYVFDKWEIVSGNGTLSGNNLTIGTQNTTVRPVFKAVEYTVTVTKVTNGSATANPTTGIKGDKVTLSAVPSDGYAFDKWEIVSGNGTLSGNNLTIGTQNTTVRPVFKEIEHKVTLSKTSNGSAVAKPSTGNKGDTVTLSAVPSDGYVLDKWEVISGDVEIDDNGSFTIKNKDVLINPVFTPGEQGECGDNLTWTYKNSDKTLIISGTGPMDDYGRVNGVSTYVNTPWYLIDVNRITFKPGLISIGNLAFHNMKNLTGNLVLPDEIIWIGEKAFYSSKNVKGDLILPKSLQVIGESAFEGCSGFDGRLSLSNNVTYIGNSAFSNCSGFTGNLTIPGSVKEIGWSAFYGCSGLTGNLTIPDSVTFIGGNAFADCDFNSAYFYGPAPVVGYYGYNDRYYTIFSIHKGFTVYCTSEHYDSFVNSDAYDAAAATWCGCPLKTFEP